MICGHKGLTHANFRRVPKDTKEITPPGIAKQWPTLLMIKLGRITAHRFTEALEPFGIRPRHVAALIELRDRGELTQQSLCGQLHLDPTNLVAILNELEQRGYATRRGPMSPPMPTTRPPRASCAYKGRRRRRGRNRLGRAAEGGLRRRAAHSRVLMPHRRGARLR